MVLPVSVAEGQQNVDARPSGDIGAGLLRVLPLQHSHERLFMIDGEDPIRGLKVGFQQGENLGAGWQGFVDSAREEVVKHIRPPVAPRSRLPAGLGKDGVGEIGLA